MNADEALRLIEAGFTAEEIRKMSTEGAPDPDDKAPNAKLPETGAENSDKIEAPAISEEMKALTGEVQKLTETVKVLQEANIKNAVAGSPKSTDPVNEAITSFIKEL